MLRKPWTATRKQGLWVKMPQKYFLLGALNYTEALNRPKNNWAAKLPRQPKEKKNVIFVDVILKGCAIDCKSDIMWILHK